MAVIFMDGFDYYNTGSNAFGPGGRKWDQNSSGNFGTGRFDGYSLSTSGNGVYSPGTIATITDANGTIHNAPQIIVGFAMLVSGYISAFLGLEYPSKPFFRFNDLNTVQCSLWIDNATQQIEVRQGDGISSPPVINTVLTTPYVPPLGLWFYLECKITIGNPGTVELFVDGQSIGSASGNLQMSANSYVNRVSFNSFNNYAGGVTGGSWNADDFYVVDPTVLTGSTDVLGEVRIQTKVPDADGYQNDWLRSQGSVSANNVNTLPVSFNTTTKYNYSGTVGAIDLYSIANFTVSGTIFAVQENIAFKKDDVGNRKIATILRTAAQNYTGPSEPCYSSYTYSGNIWEQNPSTGLPWQLTDLNLAEFGITVAA